METDILATSLPTIAGGDILSTQKSWSTKCSGAGSSGLATSASGLVASLGPGQFPSARTILLAGWVYEIISIDRYKQAAAALDSSPVGSHISEASFKTSLEAIKRRTHFLRSCCRRWSHDRVQPLTHMHQPSSLWLGHLSASIIRPNIETWALFQVGGGHRETINLQLLSASRSDQISAGHYAIWALTYSLAFNCWSDWGMETFLSQFN